MLFIDYLFKSYLKKQIGFKNKLMPVTVPSDNNYKMV